MFSARFEDSEEMQFFCEIQHVWSFGLWKNKFFQAGSSWSWWPPERSCRALGLPQHCSSRASATGIITGLTWRTWWVRSLVLVEDDEDLARLWDLVSYKHSDVLVWSPVSFSSETYWGNDCLLVSLGLGPVCFHASLQQSGRVSFESRDDMV